MVKKPTSTTVLPRLDKVLKRLLETPPMPHKRQKQSIQKSEKSK